MARSAALERDFFSMGKESNGLSSATKPLIYERRKSFRDIQGVISKMNPEVVKSVIANGRLGGNGQQSVSVASTLSGTHQPKGPQLPVCDPTLRLTCGYGNTTETAPMTIFYNGMVTVFDVSPDQAKDILEVAERSHPKPDGYSASNSFGNGDLLNGDLPITRKHSLQRFLEKRKERLTELSPYYFPNQCSSPRQSSSTTRN